MDSTHHIFPTLQSTTDEFLALVNRYKVAGLPLNRHSRMLQLSRRIAKFTGSTSADVMSEALA